MTSENIQEEQDLKEAPGILGLDDEEKFHDNEGNVVEIETRGEREHDKVYFLAKDVATAFEINQIRKITLNESGYKVHIHYTFFMCAEGKDLTVRPTKRLFLTYKGMLRILFYVCIRVRGVMRAMYGWTHFILRPVDGGTHFATRGSYLPLPVFGLN